MAKTKGAGTVRADVEIHFAIVIVVVYIDVHISIGINPIGERAIGKQRFKTGIHSLAVVTKPNAKGKVTAVFFPPAPAAPRFLVYVVPAAHPDQREHI